MPDGLHGLFRYPYTEQDWIVLTISITGTVFKAIMLYGGEEKSKFRDYISLLLVSYMMTIGLYELMIIKKWSMQVFYIPFAIAIVASKDLADWLFMSDEGKEFTKNAFITLFEKIFSRSHTTKNKDKDK